MLENVRNVLDKKVYKFTLKVISKESVDYNNTKEKNISDMETYTYGEVLVQKTMSKNWVREIITGILIPVNHIKQYCDVYDGVAYKIKKRFNNFPVYILSISDYTLLGFVQTYDSFEDSLVDNSEILQYFKIHSDREECEEFLKKAFEIGTHNYQFSQEKGTSTKAKVKQLLYRKK